MSDESLWVTPPDCSVFGGHTRHPEQGLGLTGSWMQKHLTASVRISVIKTAF